MAALLGLVWLFVPLALSVTGLTAWFMWSAATHAVLDRRWPVRWLLQHTGSPAFAELRAAGLNGMYLADLLCTNGRAAIRLRCEATCRQHEATGDRHDPDRSA
ncbi:hypothetical protein [Kitasatospora aureofaciens]|uniref:hypothetical protein n=1 Tax=Kitasatospora aureofaciens TaxID=1894 RepID=UPI0036F47B8B